MNALASLSTSAHHKEIRVAGSLAAPAAARKVPLRITCLGEAHYLAEDQTSHAYSAPRIVVLSEADTLESAMASAEFLALQGQIRPIDASAVGFTPRLFIIHDEEQCQVLAGVAGTQAVSWCEPVASDAEARCVVTDASKLRGEAMRAAAADRHDAARALRLNAAILEGRLVHPDWRQAARAALQPVAGHRAA